MPINSVPGLTTPNPSPARASPLSRLTSSPVSPDAPASKFLQPSLELLGERYNSAVGRIFESAVKTSEVFKTGVMSAWFDPVPRETSLGLWYDFRGKHSRSRQDSFGSSQSYARGCATRGLKDVLMIWNDQ
ncbi:hypothetical protein NEOLEDRAFT_1174844 [Neolentinus lepideus HHB14362 ss-1]|uniref:Uncharacterized protein n=1 Tax=Neolentinus lepideus HHB14362 ss-1 TaxID=1314782 RepID=A0A165VLC6_9AGAM|nr:hypothetical protein NEOLEDRAFT_1174844 [Neolentinus lepideus HHB14362 ss-1]